MFAQNSGQYGDISGNLMKKHFILGYGSLINSRSRAVTGRTGEVIPVKVTGFKRYWSVMSPDFGMSSVAVVAQEDAACNGVLVEVPAEELPSFDQREAGYQRVEIPAERMHTYCGRELPEGQIWIYQANRIVNPTSVCPIALSYADVILAGCFEHGETFAYEFLEQTYGWHHPLVNDRQQPRYPRVQPELHEDIDKLNTMVAKVAKLSTDELSLSYHVLIRSSVSHGGSDQ